MCVNAGQKTQNVWGNPETGYKSFQIRDVEEHITSRAHERAIKICENLTKNLRLEDYIQNQIEVKHSPKKISIKDYHLEYHNLFYNIYWVASKRFQSELLQISTNTPDKI